MNSFFRDKQ